jgi:hypothetical protein
MQLVIYIPWSEEIVVDIMDIQLNMLHLFLLEKSDSKLTGKPRADDDGDNACCAGET